MHGPVATSLYLGRGRGRGSSTPGHRQGPLCGPYRKGQDPCTTRCPLKLSEDRGATQTPGHRLQNQGGPWSLEQQEGQEDKRQRERNVP